MTTWGDTTTIYSTIADEATVDATTKLTTKLETTPTTRSSTKTSAAETERNTRARPIPNLVDLGLEEGSADDIFANLRDFGKEEFLN